tara:strand:+ start:194 stop:592 length:399 start_codon:yes stop_codon:yes gene_type:complete
MNLSKDKLPSNIKFGLFFSVIFLLGSSYSYYLDISIMFYMLAALSGIFFIITVINANLLLPLNIMWAKFGFFLAMIVSPIIMGIIFFGIFTPISIFMRLADRDELRLSLKKKKTHWIYRKNIKPIYNFKKQF